MRRIPARCRQNCSTWRILYRHQGRRWMFHVEHCSAEDPRANAPRGTFFGWPAPRSMFHVEHGLAAGVQNCSTWNNSCFLRPFSSSKCELDHISRPRNRELMLHVEHLRCSARPRARSDGRSRATGKNRLSTHRSTPRRGNAACLRSIARPDRTEKGMKRVGRWSFHRNGGIRSRAVGVQRVSHSPQGYLFWAFLSGRSRRRPAAYRKGSVFRAPQAGPQVEELKAPGCDDKAH